MIASLRDLIWLWFFGGQIPTPELTSAEILLAVAVACVLLGLYPALRRPFFLIAERARAARAAALVVASALAASWLIAALEPLAFRSLIVALAMAVAAIVGSLGYLTSQR